MSCSSSRNGRTCIQGDDQLTNRLSIIAGIGLLILASVGLSIATRNRTKRKAAEKRLEKLSQRLGDKDLVTMDQEIRELFLELVEQNNRLNKRVTQLEAQLKTLKQSD